MNMTNCAQIAPILRPATMLSARILVALLLLVDSFNPKSGRPVAGTAVPKSGRLVAGAAVPKNGRLVAGTAVFLYSDLRGGKLSVKSGLGELVIHRVGDSTIRQSKLVDAEKQKARVCGLFAGSFFVLHT